MRLKGPDDKYVTIPPKTKMVLTDYFNKFAPKQVRFVRYMTRKANIKPKTNYSIKPKAGAQPAGHPKKPVTASPEKKSGITSGREARSPRGPSRRNRFARSRGISKKKSYSKRPIGRRAGMGAVHFPKVVSDTILSISNDIGVGVLSYNRFDSLQRLISSIRAATDLTKTTVFVSDESTNFTPTQLNQLKAQKDIVVLPAQTHIGVAGNTNRLLRCLSRFKYKILLNDDVQILRPGWETFYVDAMIKTGMHHFCHREPGIYGANEADATRKTVKGVNLRTVRDKPHGAVLAFDQAAFEAVGYFDEGFGLYGMEHVDWSTRIARYFSTPGFHDVEGSENFFQMMETPSALVNRVSHFRSAKKHLKAVGDRVRVEPTKRSSVPTMTVIIPFRNNGRLNSAFTVINNIKAQKYPNLQIIVVEQDSNRFIKDISPTTYIHLTNTGTGQFNKARAFNLGVSKASNLKVILHDADIVVGDHYLEKMSVALDLHKGCHIGREVYYLSNTSTNQMNASKELLPDYECQRLVNYFEGGSLGCHKDTYFLVGGFNEEFEGYGMEDCCFFERLKALSKFYENRDQKFFHLWHGRTAGWDERHKINRAIYENSMAKYGSLTAYVQVLIQKHQHYHS